MSRNTLSSLADSFGNVRVDGEVLLLVRCLTNRVVHVGDNVVAPGVSVFRIEVTMDSGGSVFRI